MEWGECPRQKVQIIQRLEVPDRVHGPCGGGHAVRGELEDWVRERAERGFTEPCMHQTALGRF